MRILVTGGAGFIGSHLVGWLVSQGHTVRVLDNLSSGRRELLEGYQGTVDLVVGDIRDIAALQAVMQRVEYVFHLAAMVSVNQSIEQPLAAQAINATGSLQVLEMARTAGVRRVVQASSCAVYGNTERLPVVESEPPGPLSPYATTKLAAEHWGQLYTSLYGLETVSLRFFNVYGPRQDPASPYAAAIPRFIEAFASGRQPVIFGDGRQTRDFIFVEDVVQALWTAAVAPGAAGQVLNVGRGEECSILDLVELIAAMMGTPADPSFAPTRSGEVRYSRADVSRFATIAGYRAATSLRDGLAATLRYRQGDC